MKIDPSKHNVYKILDDGFNQLLDVVSIEVYENPLCAKLICVEEGILVSHMWDTRELYFAKR